MNQYITAITLVVRDYDEAIEFFTKKLHFTLVEDRLVPAQNKRWVTIALPGNNQTHIVLGRASTPEQEKHIGNQTGGRVFLFLATDNFHRDYNEMCSKGIEFVRQPKEEPYGIVAVWKDLYGNLWDLIEYKIL